MNAIAFDTLKVDHRLTEAGLDAKTAEGVSATLADVLTEREDALVTKADLHLEMANLKAEIRVQFAEHLRWTIGSIFAAMAILFAAIKLV